MLDWFLKYRICQRDQFCPPLLTFNNLRVDHLIFEKVSQSLLSAINLNIFYFFKERKKIFIEAGRGWLKSNQNSLNTEQLLVG